MEDEDVASLDGVVIVSRLSRSFGDRVALDEVTFTTPEGGRTAVVGPNGSGKTTLLRCILGTLLPTSGTAAAAGHPAGTRAARRAIGASLAQERSFYSRLSCRENLLLFARLRGLSRRGAAAATAAVLDELDLGQFANQRADRASTGQLQQLALARALIGSPQVLLLDEPTRSLDREARERLWAAVGRRTDVAVVYSTHLDDDLVQATETLELR